MKKFNRIIYALAAGTLLALATGAQVSAVSDDTSLDTRTYTVDWSEAGTLNTKRIVGTMIQFK